MPKFLIFILVGVFLVIIGTYLKASVETKHSAAVQPVFWTIKWDISSSSGGIRLYESARAQIGVVTEYDRTNGYYNGGEPPPHTGVCTDVISRAFSGMNVDFPSLVHADILNHPQLYPNAWDANIDYRRVKNLKTYFDRNALILTSDLIPGNRANFSEWQTGDIVIFDELPSSHLWHIGIIARERRDDGVPYMIDNHGYGTSVLMTPLDWPTKVIGHYRVRW